MSIIFASKKSDFPLNNKNDVVIIGRSNAGKSTLINAILSLKIAYISKKPGKTRTINFFEQEKYNLVDTPGYGYTILSTDHNEKMSKLLTEYFKFRTVISGIIHICSIKELTQQDMDMITLSLSLHSNYLLLLNKADKLGFSQQKDRLKKIFNLTKLDESQILLISAKKKQNINKILYTIKKWISHGK